MYHVKKALDLAEKYEKEGNKELSDKFFKIAEKYEKFLDIMKRETEEHKQKELYG